MASNSLGDGLRDFSVDLYKQLLPKSGDAGNIFYSPFSISAALSMALAGARKKTAKRLSKALHANSDKIHKHFSRFLSYLPGFAPDVKLHLANRMYLEKMFVVMESYLTVLRDVYGATIESVDFQNHSEEVRQQVNAWVEEATASKIKGLLLGGSVDSSTSFILVNAIYFKGPWNSQFDPTSTHRSDFYLSAKNTKEVDMMYQKNDYRMGRCGDLGVTALEIPYRGGKTSMVVLLPDELEGLSNVERHLTSAKLGNLLKDLHMTCDVMLYFPKFKLEETIDLKDTLKELGIRDFFSSSADLTGISAVGQLVASKVIHKAFVEVNEEGTEAAAATGFRVICYDLEPCTPFLVDHPFMFLIRSQDPDVVLFMGSVRQL